MKTGFLISALLGSVFAASCSFQSATALIPTGPSSVSGSSSSASPSGSTSVSVAVPSASSGAGSALDGAWASGKIAGLPNISSCTDLQWQILSQSPTSVAGSITAVCGGVATVSAHLSGEMTGSDDLSLTANGQAVALGITCGFTLTGVGHRETVDSVRLNYQGTTCLGPVSGSELLHRKTPTPAPAPPAPSTPQAPAPEPEPPPDDQAFGCTRFFPDRGNFVECVHEHINPTDEYGAFEVTKRVAWGLREDGAGLLQKPTGENIVNWRGYTFAAARIMYPDGHIYKVVSDVGRGGSNGPSWQDEGYVEVSRYLPALNPILR